MAENAQANNAKPQNANPASASTSAPQTKLDIFTQVPPFVNVLMTGLTGKPYSFKDDSGETRSGTSYKATLNLGGEHPALVKLTEDAYAALAPHWESANGFPMIISTQVSFFGKNNEMRVTSARFERYLGLPAKA